MKNKIHCPSALHCKAHCIGGTKICVITGQTCEVDSTDKLRSNKDIAKKFEQELCNLIYTYYPLLANNAHEIVSKIKQVFEEEIE